ncbi:hypothetical protein chiPu_0021954 [Chiloscyllium punctatum]|uniref:IRF tryptophan pentad repeat domain-containing protein n=1 Tax=Chiloscyllium punctatum TaxID=137246 RepID=A0A401RFY5_CHIPU|nr:hypothetical protein [Chiloscyllium punctatum]
MALTSQHKSSELNPTAAKPGPGSGETMAGGARCTRKLKQWMIEQVDSEKYPGLVWEDRKLGMFRIPWKHAGKQDYRHDEDAAIFKVGPHSQAKMAEIA